MINAFRMSALVRLDNADAYAPAANNGRQV